MKSYQNAITIIFLVISHLCYSQEPYLYTAFNGKKETKIAFVGRETVLLMPDKFKTKDSVIIKLLNVTDAFYDTYNKLNNKPGGGNPDFEKKLTIAFVTETCGAGCGLVGSKGVEFGIPTADEIYNEIKTSISRSRVALIAYEFGRNFFINYGDKIQFKGTEANGGFAEQFAGYFAVEGLRNSILYTESYRQLNEAFYHLNELYSLGKAWILDSTAKVETHLQKVATKEYGQIYDPNRNQRLLNFHTYFAGGILSIVDSVVGKGFMPKFWNEIGKLNSAKTNQDVLNNIAIASSNAANCNLSGLFLNFFRFKIDDATISTLSKLPMDNKILNRFVKDKSILYFNKLVDTIKLDLRILDTKKQNMKYVLKIKDITIDSNSIGRFNLFSTDIFKKCYVKDKSNFREILKCFAIENNSVLDSQYITIGYRDSLSLKDHINDLYIESSNNLDKITFDLANNIITMQKVDTGLDWSSVAFQYYAFPNKIYTIKGQAKTDWTSSINFNPDGSGLGNGRETYFRLSYSARASGWSDQRIGLDTHILEIKDTSRWYDISYTIVTNSSVYLPQFLDQINDPQAFNFKFAISFEQAPGIKRVQFRNMSIIDETLVKEVKSNLILTPSMPIITKDSLNFLVSSKAYGNKWFKDGSPIQDTFQRIKPPASGMYTVKTIIEGCSSLESLPYNYVITSLNKISRNNNVIIYPNPFSNRLVIDNQQSIQEKMNVSIIDLSSGRLITSFIGLKTGDQMNLSSLSPGIYYLNIHMNNIELPYKFKVVKLY